MEVLDINGELRCPQRASVMAAQRCIGFQDSGTCTCETGQLAKVEWKDLQGGVTMKQEERPEPKVGRQGTHKKRPDVFEPCSRCGDKPCNKNTWRRKWAGGVGLCLGCYDIVRKEEKGQEAPAAKSPEPERTVMTQMGPKPASSVSVEVKPEESPPLKTDADSVLLKTFNDPAAARDFVTALEDAGLEVCLEILVSAVPERPVSKV